MSLIQTLQGATAMYQLVTTNYYGNYRTGDQALHTSLSLSMLEPFLHE
jgi:hypothetical protein